MKPGLDDLVIQRKTLISRRMAAFLLGSCLVPAKALASERHLADQTIGRSQLSTGDLGRLINVFAKADRGEPITLGVIGGSITAGAFASTEQASYPGRLLSWWREKFPRCEIHMVNAGLGGTGSMYGALRAKKDLLPSKPDFVVIEFAVNDNWTDGAAFEGLVRQVLAQPNLPAVLLLFMMWENGGNDQQMQSRIGAYYHLPMVSFRDALWPEIKAGRLNWSDYIVDNVHPTDAGHAAAARFITTMCDRALQTGRAAKVDASPSLPSPLVTDAFQHVRWRDASALDATKAGRISFDWSGTGLVAVFADPPYDPRRVRFCIDGAPFKTIDALEQPKRQIIILAQDLAPGRHTVELARDDDEDSGATSQVRLLSIASIGTDRDQR
jgi:lysophospholipase L1-like esterase